MPFEIGKAFVRFVADWTDLKAGLGEAKAETKAAAASIASDVQALAKLPMPTALSDGVKQLGIEAKTSSSALREAMNTADQRLFQFFENVQRSGRASLRTFEPVQSAVFDLNAEMRAAGISLAELSAEEQEHFAAITAGAEEARIAVEHYRISVDQARNATAAGGAVVGDARTTIIAAAGANAALAARAFVALYALRELYGVLKKLGEAGGIDYSHEKDIAEAVEKPWKRALATLGDYEIKLGVIAGMLANIAGGNIAGGVTQSAMLSNQIDGKGLFAPIKRGFVPLGPNAVSGGMPKPEDIESARKAQEALNRSQLQHVLQLELETAKLHNSRDAMHAVEKQQDALLAQELTAQGFDKERIDQITKLTAANRALAEAVEFRDLQDKASAKFAEAYSKLRKQNLEQLAALASVTVNYPETFMKEESEIQRLIAQSSRTTNADRLAAAQDSARAQAAAKFAEYDKELREERITQEQHDRLVVDEEMAVAAQLSAINLQYGQDFGSMLARMRLQFGTEFDRMEQTANGVLGDVGSLLESELVSAWKGDLHGMGEAFKSFIGDMLREISHFLAQQAVLKLIGFFGNSDASMGFSAGSTAGSIINGITAHADGGVVTRPELALVGEGRYNEAVVPLPDNRSIPVKMLSGGAGGDRPLNAHFTIAIAPEVFTAGRTSGDEIIAVTLADIQRGGNLRKLIQRVARS
jgi:hypothetical protein